MYACVLFLKLTVLDSVQTSIHFYHFFFFFCMKVKSLMGSPHRDGIVPGEEVIYDKKKGVGFQRLLIESFRKP